MFINFWYPAEESINLTADKPLKVQMLGLQFVLWRDTDGRARCAHNTCTHRGGSLGDGKVVGDCIQCPYHGWKFDTQGNCIEQPYERPNSPLMKQAKIKSYPVKLMCGLIFAYLGPDPVPLLPPIAVRGLLSFQPATSHPLLVSLNTSSTGRSGVGVLPMVATMLASTCCAAKLTMEMYQRPARTGCTL